MSKKIHFSRFKKVKYKVNNQEGKKNHITNNYKIQNQENLNENENKNNLPCNDYKYGLRVDSVRKNVPCVSEPANNTLGDYYSNKSSSMYSARRKKNSKQKKMKNYNIIFQLPVMLILALLSLFSCPIIPRVNSSIHGDQINVDQSQIFDHTSLKSLEISNCNMSPALQRCLQFSPKNLIFILDVALGTETQRKVQRFLINTAQCFFNFHKYQPSTSTNSILQSSNNKISNIFTFILYDSLGAEVVMSLQPKDLTQLTRAINSLNLSRVAAGRKVKKFKPSNLKSALDLVMRRNFLQRNAYDTKVVIFANRLILDFPKLMPRMNQIKQLSQVFAIGLGSSNYRQLANLATIPQKDHLFYLSRTAVQLLHFSNSIGSTICLRDTRSVSAKKSPKYTILIENINAGRNWISFNIDTSSTENIKPELNYNIDWYPRHGHLGEQSLKFFNITGLNSGMVYIISTRPIVHKQLFKEAERVITYNTIPEPVTTGTVKIVPTGATGLDRKMFVTWIHPKPKDGLPNDAKVRVYVKENNKINPLIRTVKSQVGSAEILLDKFGVEYEVYLQSWILKNSEAVSEPLIIKKSLNPLPPLRVNVTATHLDFDPHMKSRYEKFNLEIFTPFGYLNKIFTKPTGMTPGASLLPPKSPLNPNSHFHLPMNLAGTKKPDRYYLKLSTSSAGVSSQPVVRSFNYLSRNPSFNRMLLSLSNNTVCYFNLRVMRVGNCIPNSGARIEAMYLDKITGELEQLFIDGRRTNKGVFDLFVNQNSVVSNVKMPFSIHYDSLGNNIYWSDNQGINVVHNAKSPLSNNFVSSQHAQIIRSSSKDSSTTWFTLDTVRRKLYYVSSDLDKSNKKLFYIKQSYMDGSGSEVIHELKKPNSTCLGLAVNITDGALFWLEKDGLDKGGVTSIKTRNPKTKNIITIWSHPRDLYFLQIIGTKIAVYSSKDQALYISAKRFAPKTIQQVSISKLDIAWLSSFDFKAHNNLISTRLPTMSRNPCINGQATCDGICIPLALNTRHVCISVCNIWETHCKINKSYGASGYKCIQKNLVCDGVQDCPLGDDEENCPTEEEKAEALASEEPVTLKLDSLCDGWIDFRNGADEANCGYTLNQKTATPSLVGTGIDAEDEKSPHKFVENICTFDRNDTTCNLRQSKDDQFDWLLNQGNTPTLGTGPGNITASNFIIQNNINTAQVVAHPSSSGSITKVPIATRQYPLYMYIESSGKEEGEYADMLLPGLLQGPYCLLLGAMMYGKTLGSLSVILLEKARTPDLPTYERMIFHLNKNTGQTWNFYKIDAKCESKWGCDLILRGIVGNGAWSDIAVQSLQVSQTVCHKHLNCQFDGDHESSCHSLELTSQWKKTYSLNNLSKIIPVKKATQITSQGQKPGDEKPSEWFFYDFILGNGCTLCPNGVKMLRQTKSTQDLFIGIIVCSPDNDYQIWISSTRYGVYYPIAIDTPNDIPCELMVETKDAVVEQTTNPRLAHILRQTGKSFNFGQSIITLNQVEMKSCSANFVYRRVKNNVYELHSPVYYSGYAQPFNIAIKQTCGMSFDILKAFDIPRLHHIRFDITKIRKVSYTTAPPTVIGTPNAVSEMDAGSYGADPLIINIKRPLEYSNEGDQLTGSWCFLFRYHNKKSKLTVSLDKDVIWSATDSTTVNSWNLQQFDIPVPITSYKISIQPSVNQDTAVANQAYIGIDDIQVLPYACNTATLVCKFTARQVMNTCLWNFHQNDAVLKVTETPTSLPDIANDFNRQLRNAITGVNVIRSPELQILRPLYSYMCFELVYQVMAKNKEGHPLALKLHRSAKLSSEQLLFEQTLEQPPNRQYSPWLKIKYELSAVKLKLDKFILSISGLDTVAVASISSTIGRCTNGNVVNPNISDKGNEDIEVQTICEDKGQIQCNSTAICVDYHKICDGHDDCGDWSDELGCDSGCGTNSDFDITTSNDTVVIRPIGTGPRCLWRFNMTAEAKAQVPEMAKDPTAIAPPNGIEKDSPVGILINVNWNRNKKNLTSDVNESEKIENTINSYFKNNKFIKLSAPDACYLDIYKGYDKEKALTRIRFKGEKFSTRYFINYDQASLMLSTFYEKIQTVESNNYLMRAISDNLEVTYKMARQDECDLVCSDGKCVNDNWRCDGVPACDDESDELECFKMLDRNEDPDVALPLRNKAAGNLAVINKHNPKVQILSHYCWRRGAWLQVCEDASVMDTSEIADKACYHMGFWKAESYSTIELKTFKEQIGTFSVFPSNGTSVHKTVNKCSRLLSLVCQPFPCGEQTLDMIKAGNSLAPTLRIVGGQKAKAGQWPWAISIQHNNKHNCGGTMVSDRHIVTAAHCFDFNDPIVHTVSIGHIRTIEGGAIFRKIKRGIIHEKYNPTLNIPDYDIAIVHLDRAVPINDWFRPICLPKYSIPAKPGDVCYVAGWGKQNDQFGSFPETLYDVSTPLLPNDKCLQGEYKKSDYRRQGIPITDRQTCGGILWAGGFGFCHGDSGGGLYCQDQSKRLKENSWVLHGVVSWSVGCASVDRPDVYTRTRKFIDFIENETKVFYAPNPGLGLNPPLRLDTFGLRSPVGNITCGGVIDTWVEGENIVASPGWPEKFDENLECEWRILAPKGHTVKLTFLFFNLLTDNHVTRLSISESDATGKHVLKVGTFSGTNVPRKIFSVKQMVTLRFITKGPSIWKATNGFMLEYFFENTQAITNIFKEENESCDFKYTARNDMVEFTMEPNYVLPCKLSIHPVNFLPGNETIILKFFAVELGTYFEKLSVKTAIETIQIEGHNVINKKKNITSHDLLDVIFTSQLGFESTAYFRFSYSTVMRKADLVETSQVIINQETTAKQQTTAVFEQLITETSCKNTISNATDHITVVQSPNHPYTYPRLSNCYWRLENKNKDQLIELTFKIFQVEFSSKCQYDGLKVITRKDLIDIENDPARTYDKSKPSGWTGVITFCGKTVPPKVITDGPIAYIGFYSDEFQGFEGFKIHAKAVDKENNEIADGSGGSGNGQVEIFKCDFEDGLCGMRQIPVTQSKYRWLKNHDYTPSQATGPPYDKSMSGHYLYTEATEIKPGAKAKIFTPIFQIELDDTDKHASMRMQNPTYCLSFFYDMYGESMGSLRIYLHTEETAGVDGNHGLLLWYRTGQQRSQTDLPWAEHAMIEFIPSSTFFIEFQGVRGKEYKSDMAIDELLLLKGKCRQCWLVEGMSRCGKKNECYPSELRCDGYKNCVDGEDELDCAKNSTIITIDDETEEENACFGMKSEEDLCNGKLDCLGGYDEINCVENNQKDECGVLPEKYDMRKFEHTPLNSTDWPNLATILVNNQFVCLGSLIKVDPYNAWFIVASKCTEKFYQHPEHMLNDKYLYGKSQCAGADEELSVKKREIMARKLLNSVSAETDKNMFSSLVEVIQHKSSLISILKFEIIYSELAGFYDELIANLGDESDSLEDIEIMDDIEYEIPEVKPDDIGTPACLDKNKIFKLGTYLKLGTTFNECVMIHASDHNLLKTSSSHIEPGYNIDERFAQYYITPMPIWSKYQERAAAGVFSKDIAWIGYESKSFQPPDGSLVYCRGLIDQSTRGWLLSGVTTKVREENHKNLMFLEELPPDKWGRIKYKTLSRKQAFPNDDHQDYQYLENSLGTSPMMWTSALVPWINRPCPGQFSCNDGLCINEEYLCDTIQHCADGEDEVADQCYKDHQCDNDSFWNNHGGETEINLHIENIKKDNELLHCYWVIHPPKSTNDKGEKIFTTNYDYGFAVWEMFSFYAPGFELAISFYNQRGETSWTRYPEGVDVHISNFRNKPLAVRIVRAPEPEEVLDDKGNPVAQPVVSRPSHIHLSAKLYWSRKESCEQIGGYLCRNKLRCISRSHLCNGEIDCGVDADDEENCAVECGKDMIKKSFLNLPGILRHVPRAHKAKPKEKIEFAQQFEEDSEYMKSELGNRCSFLLHAPEGKIVEMNVFKGFDTAVVDDFTCSEIEHEETPPVGHGLSLNLVKSKGRQMKVTIDTRVAFQANYKFIAVGRI